MVSSSGLRDVSMYYDLGCGNWFAAEKTDKRSTQQRRWLRAEANIKHLRAEKSPNPGGREKEKRKGNGGESVTTILYVP